MKALKKAVAAASVVAAATAGAMGIAASPAAAAPAAPAQIAATPHLSAFGISPDGTLMASFWTDTPQVLNWFQAIQGLVGDTTIVGIDFRVQDGKLYGVGNKGGIYTFGAGSSVGWVGTKVSQLSVPLHGNSFGVDFNPAADRLRVTSDTDQNLRHNLANHATVADTMLSPAGQMLTGSAYTNNDLNPATATTLFGITTGTDQVVIQSPANNGNLAPTGSLGIDVGPSTGFDIFADLVGGKTVSNTAFASLAPSSNSPSTFYMVDLLTGTLTQVGNFPIPFNGGLAVSLDMS
jgi:hypothetical protein